MEWFDLYSAKRYGIQTTGDYGDRRTARVKTFGDVLTEYEFHPEAKCADSSGKPCERDTVGLLQRRHVWISQIKYIGKESNAIEDVDSGMIHSADAVYTEYVDSQRDEWHTQILPALKKLQLRELMPRWPLSRRALINYRSGQARRPHPKNERLIAQFLKQMS